LIKRDSEYDWPTYWSNSKLFKNRVIVPFMWKGNIVGYSARSVTDNIKPKYMAHRPAGYVFNTDRQYDGRKFVVVVEGVFDAIAIDGIATLGNNINEQQADIIDSIGKEVICVPDRDQAGQEMIDYALEYGWAVSFPNWHDEVKDVSDAVGKYGKLYTMASILEGKKSNKLKINLARKKLV
jgi:DNA primase